MRLPRVHFRLRSLMVVVAIVALLCTYGYTVKRRGYRARLAELRRAEDRSRWSDRMARMGYVSRSQAAADRAAVQQAKSRLGW
jgi:hypothetical protein